MSYILILYFYGTHVQYDNASKEDCAKQADLLAQVLQRKNASTSYTSFQYQYQCWPQTPILIELANNLGGLPK